METKTQTPEKTATRKSVRVSGAEAVILSLLEEGVDTIFGYVGGAIMPVYDALYNHTDNIHHVMVRHEQGAVHAAQGYARTKKRPGVCFTTSGPGATNLTTGLADAMLDSTPLVCITGQVVSKLLGTDAFQETDVLGISMPVTKWNFQITKAEEIPEAFARAFYIANSGRPGPVLLDITKDAQISEFNFLYKKQPRIRSYMPYPKIDLNAIQAGAKLINEARKPMILAGHGILLSEGQEVFREFVEKTGIPVGSTLLGLSALPSDHPLFTGMLGMHGNYGPNMNTNQADLIIAVGMRFDDRVTGNLDTYAKQAKIIHIDIDRSEINKNVQTDVAILADAKQALAELLNYVDKKSYPEWLDTFNDYNQVEFEKIIAKDCHPTSDQIKMGEVIHQISNVTKGEAIIVSDVGQHQMATARYYQFNKPFSHVTSGGLGTMGFGLPAAMGVSIARPARDIIAVIGDGGFQMTIQELGTIAQYKLPVKIVLLNNSFLGMVRQWQDLFFEKRYSMTGLTNPDFTKVGEGFGVPGKKITERAELKPALEAMLKAEGPFLLEVKVEKETNVFPMVPAGGTVSEMKLE